MFGQMKSGLAIFLGGYLLMIFQRFYLADENADCRNDCTDILYLHFYCSHHRLRPRTDEVDIFEDPDLEEVFCLLCCPSLLNPFGLQGLLACEFFVQVSESVTLGPSGEPHMYINSIQPRIFS